MRHGDGPKPKKKRTQQKKLPVGTSNEFELLVERISTQLRLCPPLPRRALEPIPRIDRSSFAACGLTDLPDRTGNFMPYSVFIWNRGLILNLTLLFWWQQRVRIVWSFSFVQADSSFSLHILPWISSTLGGAFFLLGWLQTVVFIKLVQLLMPMTADKPSIVGSRVGDMRLVFMRDYYTRMFECPVDEETLYPSMSTFIGEVSMAALYQFVFYLTHICGICFTHFCCSI